MTAVPDPCILVIFGASGDLTHRKLIPALYDVSRKGGLPARFAIVGVSRTPMTDDQFAAKMLASFKEATGHPVDRAAWDAFARCLHYYAGDAADPAMYPGLTTRLQSLGVELGIARAGGPPNLLFYLSVSPNLYEPILARIGESGLVTEGKRWCSLNPAETPWQRIIVEKPFGTDLESARSLNMALGRVFEEDAIYRIDHYLGKELVQNILVMRFANSLFEPVWDRRYIDHVQVTAVETLGVGTRAANFYDRAGALRDMVQSHLLQVLALVAIEPPSVFDAAAVMRERIKLFNSASPIPPVRAHEWAVLGRYAAGKDGPAYVEEKGVDPERRTETYAAMRVHFDNWRWNGVPFYLRSGKRLAAKRTEIVVQFKRPPTNMFRLLGAEAEPPDGNRLVVRVAPDEGLSLMLYGKVPGQGLRIADTELELDYKDRFGGEAVEAYGPLLIDAMRGDRTLYKHRDEVEGSWRICQPLLDSEPLRRSIESYAPGSWGPPGADALLARDGRRWHNPA
jgi:glucose-6-phosphate 1-dehydrogenase